MRIVGIRSESPDPPRPIALTMGDPAGIGPDVTLASWCAREAQLLHPFVVYGSAALLRARARLLGLDVPIAAVANLEEASKVFTRALPVLSATDGGETIDLEGGDELVLATIERAAAAAMTGEALAIVTNPIAKKSLRSVALEYPGHTAFLGLLASRYAGQPAARPVMMMVSGELKVVPATVHIPLREVPRVLTPQLLLETVRTTASALVRDFGIQSPRIALAGLNPHAGEFGLIGTEEEAIIAPAVAELVQEGLAVTGPHSADAMFHEAARSSYDAAIAMYHDQALIPLKTLAFNLGVNVTLGLPFVRTSPDHGTAYSLAGTGKARPDSLIAALKLAAQLGSRRAASARPAT